MNKRRLFIYSIAALAGVLAFARSSWLNHTAPTTVVNGSVPSLGFLTTKAVIHHSTAPSTGVHGYTESNGTPSSDDQEHCFKQDDKRTLVLDVNAGRDTGSATTQLVDLNSATTTSTVKVIPSDPPDPQAIHPGVINTFRFKDHAIDRRSEGTMIQHLGQGPYLAVTSISTTAKDGRTINAGNINYYYETFVDNASECSLSSAVPSNPVPAHR